MKTYSFNKPFKINEANVTIKRKWTDAYPEININPDAILRNRIVNFIGEFPYKRCTKSDLESYFERLLEDEEIGRQPSFKYIHNNPHLFKQINIGGERYIKLTPVAVRVFNYLSSVNESISSTIIKKEELSAILDDIKDSVPLNQYKFNNNPNGTVDVEFDDTTEKELENYAKQIVDATSNRVKIASIEPNKIVLFPNKVASASKDRIGGIMFHPPIFNDSQAPADVTPTISESISIDNKTYDKHKCSDDVFMFLYGLGTEKVKDWEELGFERIDKCLPKVSEDDFWMSTEGTFKCISEDEYEEIQDEEISCCKIKDGYLYRKSNCWGVVDSCIWDLKDNKYNGCAKIKIKDLKRRSNGIALTKEKIDSDEIAKIWVANYLDIAKKTNRGSSIIKEGEDKPQGDIIKSIYKKLEENGVEIEISEDFENAIINRDINSLVELTGLENTLIEEMLTEE